ncbi:MAG: molybdopterin oxidoreductase [Bacillota bacterium]|nr:MAG: molybdopterin oxidoreductase [Bacillota bacterium]
MELVCIECPRGCLLKAEKTESGVMVTGNFCPKGKAYAEAELIEPRRVITSTVRADGAMVPVKTDRAVKKTLIFSLMRKIRGEKLLKNVQIGDIIIENIDGEGTNVVAAAPYEKRE